MPSRMPWVTPPPLRFLVADDTVLRTDYENVEIWSSDEIKLALNEISKDYGEDNPPEVYHAVIALTTEFIKRDKMGTVAATAQRPPAN